MSKDAWYERTVRNLGSLEAMQGGSGYGPSASGDSDAKYFDFLCILESRTLDERVRYRMGDISPEQWAQWENEWRNAK